MKRFIISGGGTGGHIFPALAIANGLKKAVPDAEILFIGANGKMEMKRVPEAGYRIEGLDVYGIKRSFSPKAIISNLKLPFLLLKTTRRAKQIIADFKPDIAIGVGGFASGPALKAADSMGIPTFLQEQNSYPGVTNKILSAHARKICVAYDGLEKYFPAEKIVKTGNPIRAEILNMQRKSDAAYEAFDFKKDKKTLLVVGGSLGARTINQCMEKGLDKLAEMGIQVLWQTGESFYKTISPELLARQNENIKIVPFIRNMNDAYSMADIIVSRAGALAIAELCVVGAPTILVPFPFAAEDHQTKNAQALVDKGAAIMIPDDKAAENLMLELVNLISDEEKCAEMGKSILKLAQPDAIDLIVEEILRVK